MMRGIGAPSTGALRRRLGIVACVLAGAGAAACGPPPRTGDVAVVASGADLESANPLVTLHPLARQVQRYVLFVTLAQYDSLLAPHPYFARRWEWGADRRRLTLYLHPSLHWHDGTRTTSRDVAFTLDAARDPATGYPRQAELAILDGVETPDDTTVVLHFVSPPPSFPSFLIELPVAPAHRLAEIPRAELRRADFGDAPVGNGPFRFVRREPGQRWIFERSPGFPEALGGPPRLRRLVIAVVDEATTKFAGLVSGELHVAGIAPTMAELAAEDPALRVLSYPVLFSTALVFNTTRSPWNDPVLRRAIDASIDRERIIEAALAGYAAPASGPVSADNPLGLADTRRYDPARADSLLEAAGWSRDSDGWRAKGGTPLRLELMTVVTGDNALEQLVQADLAARGVRATVRPVELGALLAAARGREKRFDALVTGIPGDLGLSHLVAMYDSRLAGGPLDYGGYHTARLDALLAAAAEAPDVTALRDRWLAVQRELIAEAPAVWLYHARGVQGLSRRLQAVQMDLRGELPTVAQWYLEAAPSTAESPVVAAERDR